ncbi:MAG: asparaginase, partial [Pseudomonadota bacterium]
APKHRASRVALARAGTAPSQLHNQCSGKHAGFLTAATHFGGGPEYAEPGHPVQEAVRAALSEICDYDVTQHAIDGCSAPNFAVSLAGLATAMARFAAAETALEGARSRAAQRLREAMAAHPHLVAAEGDATTDLMRACGAGVALKSGAAGVYMAALPTLGLGLALKIDDGDDAASSAAVTALLARLGVLERDNPVHARFAEAPIVNWRGILCGQLQPGEALTRL